MTTPRQYEHAKKHYRDPAIAEGYDSWRFNTAQGQKRNRRKLAAIARALRSAAAAGHPVRSAIDMPCGTGRLFPLLEAERIRWYAADISMEMMRVAADKAETPLPPFLQCNGEALPFRDEQVDCIFSIRFMFHVPRAVRQKILVEMARVTRRWVIVDFRHRYNFRYASWVVRHRLGLMDEVRYRFSRADLARDLREAGLELRGIYPTHTMIGWFSDKWVVLAEKIAR